MNLKGMRQSSNVEIAPPFGGLDIDAVMNMVRETLGKWNLLDPSKDYPPPDAGNFGMTDDAGWQERRQAAAMLIMRQFGLEGKDGQFAANAVLNALDTEMDSVDRLYDYYGVQWDQ